MKKIVVNRCYGGFGLSKEAKERYIELKGINKKADTFYAGDIPRDDPILIQIVEELGKRANGTYAELEIVEIPDGVEWEIDDYDGSEQVEEKHRSW